jgi:hypothetical protein
MTTFQLIINKILKIEDTNFFTHIEGIDSTIRNFFLFDKSIKDESIPLYKNKFEIFVKGLDYFMIKKCKEEEFIIYFNRIQRIYHILNRFAYKYKLRRAPIIVYTDMTLNELKENDKNVICIYQKNSRYLFKIHDLLKIINMSLTNPQGFFSNPLCIKNPYNNLPFGKNVLYYIYYFIREKTNIASNIKYTELFFKFHDCNFNLTIFLSKYEYLLREKIIENCINNSTNDKLYTDIMMMLRIFNSKNIKNRITIDDKFPKKKIIEIFKPYLVLYINGNFSLIPSQKYKASCELEKKLKKFQKFNPLFGRTKIIFKKEICENGKVKILKDKLSFNDKYICFYDSDNDIFLKDHLSYSYIHYTNNMSDEENETDDEITISNTQIIYEEDYNEEDYNEEDYNEEDYNEEDYNEEDYNEEED